MHSSSPRQYLKWQPSCFEVGGGKNHGYMKSIKAVISANIFVCKVIGDCKQKQTALLHSVEQRGILKNNATSDASVPDNGASQHSYLLPPHLQLR
jgi:hypothetical protein